MRQWEYCIVVWKVRQASDSEVRELQEQGFDGRVVELEDGTKVAQLGLLNFLGSAREAEAIVDLEETIAQLGRDGWELASHAQITSPTAAQVFYFKRQKQGE